MKLHGHDTGNARQDRVRDFRPPDDEQQDGHCQNETGRRRQDADQVRPPTTRWRPMLLDQLIFYNFFIFFHYFTIFLIFYTLFLFFHYFIIFVNFNILCHFFIFLSIF